MLLIWGERICGRIDHVPGKCHVATRFFHLYYVPLIPLSSWVIVEGTESEQGFHGCQIGMSGKSVLFGWLQAALVVFGIINLIWGVIALTDPVQAADHSGAILKFVLGVLSLGVWVLFNFRPLQASAERADQLLQHLGTHSLSDEVSVD